MSLLETLTSNLPDGFTVESVHVGLNWVLSLVKDATSKNYAGVAASPHSFLPQAPFPHGSYLLNQDVKSIAQLLASEDESASAVGLASLNAILQPQNLSHEDAADWLSLASKDKSIAIVGRFPFIEDEIRPFAKQVFTFEQNPQTGEYSANDMPRILPQADIIAITGSTVINHTIDGILEHVGKHSQLVMLGPSTPLTSRLFDCGFTALFGVRVFDIDAAKSSVHAGDGFQKMQGLERVALFRKD